MANFDMHNDETEITLQKVVMCGNCMQPMTAMIDGTFVCKQCGCEFRNQLE